MIIKKIKPACCGRGVFRRPVIVFGIGEMFKRVMQRYQLFDQIAFLCDNDSAKWGTRISFIDAQDCIREFLVLSPEQLCEKIRIHPDKWDILVVGIYAAEIAGQLKEMLPTDTITCYSVGCSAYARYKFYGNLKTQNIKTRDRYYKILYLPERLKMKYRNWASCVHGNPIEDAMSLRKFVKKNLNAIKSTEFINYESRNNQSHYYGAIYALFRYGNIPFRNMIFFPEMEHGKNGLLAKYRPNVSYLFMGCDLNKETRAYSPDSPIFNVGPYIHYVKASVQAEAISKMRKRNGKTLLFFLQHSIESSRIIFDENAVLDQIYQLKKLGSFQTVLVCVYWADLHTEFVEKIKRQGYIVVSAGIRSDPAFLSRLKALICFSDGAASNEIGTYVPYCTYMKKPFILQQQSIISNYSSRKRAVLCELQEYTDSLKSDFYVAYATNHFDITKAQIDVCEKHFGFSLIKSPNEISAIAEVNFKIWKKSEFVEEKYADAAKQLLNDLEKKVDERSQMLYKTLKQALE